jgi:hypothetical protein
MKLLFAISLSALAVAQSIDFRRDVYPVLEEKNCRGCHVDNGVASGTRLHFPEANANPAEIESFGKRLVALVDKADPASSLLVQKPSNRAKHTGGRLILPGSKQDQVLLAWAERLAAMTPAELAAPEARPARSAPRVMRRLTHSQYNNTVRDLLGDQTGPANQFPQEDYVNGFKNQVEAQGMPALLTEAYGAAAERLGRNAFRGGDPNGLIPCKPRSAADPGCRDSFLRSFGLKAFRRPLNGDELARYGALFNAQAQRSNSFHTAAQLTVEAMLQSPHFLFRVETGEPETLPYEIAARLSYSLWDSMPDHALFQAAASGELSSPAGIEKQARRLLADDKARQSVNEFISQWLRFDRVLGQVKDRRQFPMYNSELSISMTEETRRFIGDAIWNDRDFTTIFSADYSFLSSDLAALYKLPPPPEEFARVTLPPESERAGIIGQATFLALTSKPGDTSPTARGLFVREAFLCQNVPPPPPGANANLPPPSEAKPMTNRDRLAEHLSNASCATCHKLIDSIGFGLEKFDAVGQRREKHTLVFTGTRQERDKKPVRVELPIDTSGSISGLPDSEFSSPRELGKVLAASEQCQECAVKQYFRFTYGRHEAPADRAVIKQAFARFRDSQFRFKELMIALVTAYARGE